MSFFDSAIAMFSAESHFFHGCIRIIRGCCEAMCFPWRTYQFLFVKKNTLTPAHIFCLIQHFPNLPRQKLVVWFILQNSAQVPIFIKSQFSSHISHQFPFVSLRKLHISPCLMTQSVQNQLKKAMIPPMIFPWFPQWRGCFFWELRSMGSFRRCRWHGIKLFESWKVYLDDSSRWLS